MQMPSSLTEAAQLPGREYFGTTAQGEVVEVFTLTNARGVRLRAINLGAVVLSLETPDRTGTLADIVLGFNTLEEYLTRSPYFGAVVGRYGNRIASGRFVLDGVEYALAQNNTPGGMPCALHGGVRGFDKVVWAGEGMTRPGAQGVRFSYTSADGEEGYPGKLEVSVTYWLNEESVWSIDYQARSDKATPVNLTQHAFFNLRGEGTGDVLGHELSIFATRFTPVNTGMIPTGEIRSVAGTPLDFTRPVLLGARIEAEDPQLQLGNGYDHNYVLDHADGPLTHAATVYEPELGRVMEVFTTEPGMQLYCGNFLDGSLKGKSGRSYGFRGGLCLETQHYPDSPNQPEFPSTILRPGEVLRSKTEYRFHSR